MVVAVAVLTSAPVAWLGARALATSVPEMFRARSCAGGFGEGVEVASVVTKDGQPRNEDEACSWSVGDFLVRVCVPAGLVTAALMGIAGVALGRRWMVIAGSAVMIVETLFVFTIAPLTLLAGVSFAWIAIRMRVDDRTEAEIR